MNNHARCDDGAKRALGDATHYWTERHRSLGFSFAIARLRPGHHRVYIVDQPTYGSRNADWAHTHSLRDSRGRRYISWGIPIATADDAMIVARGWAERTARYASTGTHFDVPIPTEGPRDKLFGAEYSRAFARAAPRVACCSVR